MEREGGLNSNGMITDNFLIKCKRVDCNFYHLQLRMKLDLLSLIRLIWYCMSTFFLFCYHRSSNAVSGACEQAVAEGGLVSTAFFIQGCVV